MTATLQAEEEKQLSLLLGAVPESLPTVNCDTYRTYRPILQAALPLISKIPFVGAKVATAITFLMSIADSLCNVSTAQAAQPAGGAATGCNCPPAAGRYTAQFAAPQTPYAQQGQGLSIALCSLFGCAAQPQAYAQAAAPLTPYAQQGQGLSFALCSLFGCAAQPQAYAQAAAPLTPYAQPGLSIALCSLLSCAAQPPPYAQAAAPQQPYGPHGLSILACSIIDCGQGR
ncbi:hypothetical protein [Corallococcus exiguus]|uniref:hypothetical protein n=1 Tax=Corallococcus exiguus TaxID=83462 RepID=UPI0015614B96|nr:hypothetical protein [Corallococcus exiguus]NRD51003.1 hypothetical protein [Corallococcus exiguus]